MSSASLTGSSSAAKCPPDGMSVQSCALYERIRPHHCPANGTTIMGWGSVANLGALRPKPFPFSYCSSIKSATRSPIIMAVPLVPVQTMSGMTDQSWQRLYRGWWVLPAIATTEPTAPS